MPFFAATLDVLFDALVDQDLGKFIRRGTNVEAISCQQRVFQRLVIVRKVEVKLGQKDRHQGTVGELHIVMKGLAG